MTHNCKRFYLIFLGGLKCGPKILTWNSMHFIIADVDEQYNILLTYSKLLSENKKSINEEKKL